MAYIDERSGDVVVRLAWDGASSAGKTTNLQRLHAQLLSGRPGDVISPETTGRATAWFDWRELNGGIIDDRRVRLQLISVPGQPSRLHVRRHLLGLADGVVFVVDADPQRHDVNVAMARELNAMHEQRGFELVVQQNKIDLGHRAAEAILRDLALPADTLVVDAHANDDVGVSRTFLAISQRVTARVRADLAGGVVAVGAGLDDVQLHGQLRALDDEARPPLPRLTDIIEAWPSTSASVAVASSSFAQATPVAASAGHLWHGGGHVIDTAPSWSCETDAEAKAVFDVVVTQQRRALLAGPAAPPPVVLLCRDAGFFRVWLLQPQRSVA